MKTVATSYALALLLSCSSIFAATAQQGYKQIECTITPKKMDAEKCSHPHMPAPKSVPTKSSSHSQMQSLNWSGYAAATNLTSPANNSVSAVSASWIVPTVTRSTPSASSDSAFWIGIDGYSSSTVEQIGTSHNWINGAPQHYAWFEMYPAGSYSITDFPLNPGDVISATIVYSTGGIFTMTLYNDTQLVSYTIPTSYTTNHTAQRNSAEWIVEAPYQNTILPLSDFGTAYMWGCNATINNVAGVLNNSAWQNANIEMIATNNTAVATTSPVYQDGGSFSVKWVKQ